MTRSASLSIALLITITLLLVAALGCGVISNEQPFETPLKIGLLLNFTGSPEASADRQRAFELAIKHVNECGGVLGMPVEGVVADATQDPAAAVEAARRLVEVEGVHAIVGPNASSASLPVSQNVSGPLRIPTISPSATSPQLTGAEDSDYFFRTALSDAAQGPVLARVTRERGFDNVGLIYQDDPYGQGLADSFEESWDGTLRVVSVAVGQTGFLAELKQSASAGAQALVLIAFEDMAISIVREAIDEGIYSQFVFGDAAKRASLVREIGGQKLGACTGLPGLPRLPTPQRLIGKQPSSPSTASCPSSHTSRRPTTLPWRLPLLPRPRAVSKEPQSVTTCGTSADHRAATSWALPKASPMDCPCSLKGRRSTSMALPAHWTGTKTAISVEAT